jgi:Flp pilus assembly protein TadG
MVHFERSCLGQNSQTFSHLKGRGMVRNRPKRRGSVLVLAAVLMVVMLIFLAFAIDVGYMAVVRTQLQVAADSAALAGAAALRDGSSPARTAAENYAQLNVAAGELVEVVSNDDIQLGLWNEDTRSFEVLSGADEEDSNAVLVTCRRIASRGNPVNLMFARVMGYDVTDMSASAIARVKVSVCGQIVGLNRVSMSGSSYTDSYISNNGPYTPGSARNRGHVCCNGPILMSGSSQIRGNAHPGPGFTVMGTQNVTGNMDPLSEPLNYPPVDPGDAATNNNNGSIPLTSNGSQAVNGSGQLQLSGGDTLDLPPGKYYFTRITLLTGATLRLSGQTIIYVNGDCSSSGASIVNANQKPSELELYVMGSNCALSGGGNFYGVIYAPTARITRSSTSDYYGMLIGREIVLSGSGGVHADESLGTLQGTTNRAVLVE